MKIELKKKIGILGLGYVGLPLAVKLSSSFQVIGFDISSLRVSQLHKGIDETLEVSKNNLINSLNKNLTISNNEKDLKNCNIYIATVPTPIDERKKPDFSFLVNVCKTIGKLLQKGDLVIFESTVHPGATEEICGPELEKNSKNLKCGKDFFLGYSPERVNPGDKVHTIDKINKVIAGQNKDIERIMFDLYSNLTDGEIFIAKNIKVAEASKVIENSQRDINIAFINEIAKICQKIDISIYDVLDASLTKWNFLDFKPGLVGGHCIGVDPYYLSEKAKKLKINPQVILSGRQTNDGMGKFIAKSIEDKIKKNSKILFLGVTFKEDVPDMRNSKSLDLMQILKKRHRLYFHDPYIKKLSNFDFANIESSKIETYDMIVLCVPHKYYTSLGEKKILRFLKKEGIFFDLKGYFRNRKLKNYFSL